MPALKAQIHLPYDHTGHLVISLVSAALYRQLYQVYVEQQYVTLKGCLSIATCSILISPGRGHVMHARRGKDQPSYSPSMDMGGYVIIINADKVTVTGNKFNDKLYRSHPTAKPGTLKTETFKQLNEVWVHVLAMS